MVLQRIAPLAFRAAPWPLAGARPTLVCIHGSGGDHSLWGAQVEGLPAVANVVAVDLPGHGASGGTALDSVSAYARVLAGFLTELAPASPVVCGLSLGGAIALELLLGGDVPLAGGILVGTGARLRVRPAIFETLATNFDGFVKGLATLGASPSTDPRRLAAIQAAARACGPQVTAEDFRACDRFDVMDRLCAVQCPVLVVTAADDCLTPPKYGEYLAAHIPGARLVCIPEAGHLAPVERPEAFNRAVCDFLQGLAGCSAA
jgi:pimeloyl-ACP methyl ester carboxylesterase